MKQNLLIAAFILLSATIAQAEPFWACNVTLAEQDHGLRQWIQAEMAPGSSIPDQLSNPHGQGQGTAEGDVSLQLADGRTVDLHLVTSMAFTGKYNFNSPVFESVLDFEMAERGQGVIDTAHLEASNIHYLSGFMVLNKDLSLKRILATEGAPSRQEREEGLIVTFFCAPHLSPRK